MAYLGKIPSLTHIFEMGPGSTTNQICKWSSWGKYGWSNRSSQQQGLCLAVAGFFHHQLCGEMDLLCGILLGSIWGRKMPFKPKGVGALKACPEVSKWIQMVRNATPNAKEEEWVVSSGDLQRYFQFQRRLNIFGSFPICVWKHMVSTVSVFFVLMTHRGYSRSADAATGKHPAGDQRFAGFKSNFHVRMST